MALSLCFGLLSGCSDVDDHEIEQDPEIREEIQQTDEELFDLLLDEMFADWVTNDALTMNYFLAEPQWMNIDRPETTFGEIASPESIARDKQETQDLSIRLDGFTYGLLREDQQIIYDILKRIIDLSEVLEREDDFPYYIGYIRPMTGIQVQLPVLLAEFNFYTVEDIDRYLDLIGDTHRYYSDIIEFERERSRRGFFLSEYNVDSVIEQIESFLENRENNLLISVFDYKIDNYPGLSEDQREQYKKRNRVLVIENVLHAYDTLLIAMKELRGVGARQGGLADLPWGAEYAHALLQLRVGTDKSANELEVLLQEWMELTLMTILDMLHGELQMFDSYLEGELGQIDDGTPKSYISRLEKHMAREFPPIDDTQLVVLEVHESLQEHMSPAFYLAPAIDRFNENVVYVNPASINENLFMFTVLAHESYPGHMYQTVYFLQQSPHPIRVSLSNTGYTEGWATYAEMMSYYYADISYEEALLMWSMRLYDMLLQSMVDLGVNVTGWSYQGVSDFLEGFGITEEDIVESIYNRATGLPLNSLNYSLGYIEMIDLLSAAMHTSGNDFELMDFHRFILDFGPAPYPIIKDYMDEQLRAA